MSKKTETAQEVSEFITKDENGVPLKAPFLEDKSYWWVKVGKKMLEDRKTRVLTSPYEGETVHADSNFFIYQNMLVNSMPTGVIPLELFKGQELSDALSEYIERPKETCKRCIERMEQLRMIEVITIDNIAYVVMMDLHKFVGESTAAEKQKRYRETLKLKAESEKRAKRGTIVQTS